EALTNRLEADAEKYFAEIERRGGVVPCIDSGYIQREIHRSAVAYQAAGERRPKKIAGVHCYVEDQTRPTTEPHRIGPAVERDQHERLTKLRATRDAAQAKRELDAIRTACKSGGNLLERFVAAAHADCTLGEIADVLREQFGVYKEPKIL